MVKVLDFFASWCPPCQQMMPIIAALEKEFSAKISFEKVDVDKESEKAARYGVLSVPTFIVEKNGREVDRITGARSKDDFREWLEGYL